MSLTAPVRCTAYLIVEKRKARCQCHLFNRINSTGNEICSNNRTILRAMAPRIATWMAFKYRRSRFRCCKSPLNLQARPAWYFGTVINLPATSCVILVQLARRCPTLAITMQTCSSNHPPPLTKSRGSFESLVRGIGIDTNQHTLTGHSQKVPSRPKSGSRG